MSKLDIACFGSLKRVWPRTRPVGIHWGVCIGVWMCWHMCACVCARRCGEVCHWECVCEWMCVCAWVSECVCLGVSVWERRCERERGCVRERVCEYTMGRECKWHKMIWVRLIWNGERLAHSSVELTSCQRCLSKHEECTTKNKAWTPFWLCSPCVYFFVMSCVMSSLWLKMQLHGSCGAFCSLHFSLMLQSLL